MAIIATVIIAALLVIEKSYCQLLSPCPNLFQYEPRNHENDRWYGQIILLSDADLSGVWLRIIFDKGSIQLGNWFAEVEKIGHREYLIKNGNYTLRANTPKVVKFYLRYNANSPPPQLVGFRLNGKTLCPESSVSGQPPNTSSEMLISYGSDTSAVSSHNLNQPSPLSTFFQESDNGGGDEDDYFHSDFAFLNKPQQNTSKFLLESTCGVVIKRPTPLISYGQASEEGEFPWHAALYEVKNVDLRYICAGSLISNNHIITVANCVTRKKSGTTVSPNDLLVYLGKYYLRAFSNPEIQDKRVQRITVHPQYDPETFLNNIAIVKLETPAIITDFVRTVCLWEGSNALEPIIGKEGTTAGWGFDETGEITLELRKAVMPIVSKQTCINSNPEFFSRYVSSTTFCAGYRNGTSVCNGDSGGGLVLPKHKIKPLSPVWQLRGLISIGVALPNRFKCDTLQYAIFTDVAKYLEWIIDTLKM